MMAPDGENYQRPGMASGPSSAAKLVAVPFIPDLAKHSQMKRLSAPSIVPVPQHSSLRAPSEFQNTAAEPNSSNIERRVATPISASEQAVPQPPKLQYDVYAKSYVPQSLRAINEEVPRSVIDTTSKHKIAFASYIGQFAGTGFLTPRHDPRYNLLHVASPQTSGLTEQTYAQHLGPMLQQESVAHVKRNRDYTLYAVYMQAILTSDGMRLWAVVVPGLREDDPLVEMGDVLQVRQLWVDWAGYPTRFPGSVFTPTVLEYGLHAAERVWTGTQFNASVYGVSRIRETVYLRVDGLQHIAPYVEQSVLPMFVNIVFPLKQRILRSQHRALLAVSEQLTACGQISRDIDSYFQSSLGNDIEPTRSRSDPQSDWIRRMLFPTEHDGQLQTKLRTVPHRALFDHAINYEQAHAVNSVCTLDYGTLPYLISGPPGTGKTKTLVETAMQLLNTTDVAHMLICAPSEAAADTFALRLKQYLTPKQLLRLNGPNRADNEVPRELLQYCYVKDDMFYLPPFRTLLAYSIVVTSCRDATILAEARLTNADLWTMERDLISTLHPEDEPPTPSLHWKALLLDEAAQATEVDVLPAISVVCPPSAYPQDHAQPRMVLAGDEHQLGPRTASHDPAFSRSLFARLFARPVYANHPLDRSYVKSSSGPPVLKRSMLPILYPPFTNLIRNYRSHPSILSIPSSLFYHDTLIPEAPTPCTPLQSSPIWRGRKWPVLYIPHTSPDDLERDNGGWYNTSEARLACTIAESLVLSSGVKQEDICIMSPFAAQVKLLRGMIRRETAGGAGLWDVNIGPVEAFQGLERRVVILCTTRTRMRFVEEDRKRDVGLMGQRRKMNVALTRAREGLIVIGSPEVMGVDQCWRAWMVFCERNGLVDDRMGV
jgi:helicase MOV-10